MSCVSSLIAVRLDAGESTVPLFARFAYSADLPYAVQADFLDGLAVLASWQFDRTMLADGLRRPVGEGDVTFGPHRGAGGHEIRIGLGSPAENEDGRAVLFAEARALKGFLRQTYDVVGEGEESMDVDKLLDEILAR
ncbi:SsgA family sporulation/cell division regulator [Streptomyces sp. adm13(2018)]|uniref:SsgA family sporulation/cell division regulator n=1 Tax=unclassified Streptomyces TaxID=2593676 RepID=UPI0011CE9775|nr:SsgA family sporulation/cell division regulator [Streptomyces sp. adm13(2018)]TXS01535.1 SsgA family sporulation/cell division regulator [Streptomyces sp. adm13(2018)]